MIDAPPSEPKTENRIYLEERLAQEGITKSPIFNTPCSELEDDKDYFVCELRNNEVLYNEDVLVLLIQFESHWDNTRKNPKSTAKGYGQILKSTFNGNCEGSRENGRENLDCVVNLLDRPQGLRHYCADHNTSRYLNGLQPGICPIDWIDKRSYTN